MKNRELMCCIMQKKKKVFHSIKDFFSKCDHKCVTFTEEIILKISFKDLLKWKTSFFVQCHVFKFINKDTRLTLPLWCLYSYSNQHQSGICFV